MVIGGCWLSATVPISIEHDGVKIASNHVPTALMRLELYPVIRSNLDHARVALTAYSNLVHAQGEELDALRYTVESMRMAREGDKKAAQLRAASAWFKGLGVGVALATGGIVGGLVWKQEPIAGAVVGALALGGGAFVLLRF